MNEEVHKLMEEQSERRLSVLARHLSKGVVILDLASTYIDETAEIGEGTVIYPNNHILGGSRIGKNCIVEPNNIIDDCRIGDGVHVVSSVLKGSKIGDRATVGPFAYLRPNSDVGEDCRVGDFVELKSATLGRGTKVSHLTYVGDAQLGQDCNVGCGVVFANYDGEKKFKSVVGDECFIGSNCNLVAPVTVGDRAYIAAGTTVTKDVEPDKFVIGRVRQQYLDVATKYRKK